MKRLNLTILATIITLQSSLFGSDELPDNCDYTSPLFKALQQDISCIPLAASNALKYIEDLLPDPFEGSPSNKSVREHLLTEYFESGFQGSSLFFLDDGNQRECESVRDYLKRKTAQTFQLKFPTLFFVGQTVKEIPGSMTTLRLLALSFRSLIVHPNYPLYNAFSYCGLAVSLSLDDQNPLKFLYNVNISPILTGIEYYSKQDDGIYKLVPFIRDLHSAKSLPEKAKHAILDELCRIFSPIDANYRVSYIDKNNTRELLNHIVGSKFSSTLDLKLHAAKAVGEKEEVFKPLSASMYLGIARDKKNQDKNNPETPNKYRIEAAEEAFNQAPSRKQDVMNVLWDIYGDLETSLQDRKQILEIIKEIDNQKEEKELTKID